MIAVALVEDDVEIQNVIAAAISTSSDMRMVGVADTRAKGLLLLEGRPADVLMVDLGLPDGSGLDVIRVANERWPRCTVLVNTSFADEQHVMNSIEMGAAGYLLKDGAASEVLSDIRSAHGGGSPISPLIARQILNRFRGNTASQPPQRAAGPAPAARTNLSPREREVLEFITKGYTALEIAGLTLVSPHTVQTYVRRIYGKLEVRSKAEAIYEARLQGLLPDGRR